MTSTSDQDVQTIKVPSGASDLALTIQAKPGAMAQIYRIQLDQPDTTLQLRITLHPQAGELLHAVLQVTHLAPRTKSTTIIKSVHQGRTRTKVEATLHVGKDAEESEANFDHQALLMSDTASLVTIPSTECLNYHAICNHAASIQVPDEAIINYLLSRGLSTKQAHLLVQETFYVFELAIRKPPPG